VQKAIDEAQRLDKPVLPGAGSRSRSALGSGFDQATQQPREAFPQYAPPEDQPEAETENRPGQ
jgi:hypothetical protein